MKKIFKSSTYYTKLNKFIPVDMKIDHNQLYNKIALIHFLLQEWSNINYLEKYDGSSLYRMSLKK